MNMTTNALIEERTDTKIKFKGNWYEQSFLIHDNNISSPWEHPSVNDMTIEDFSFIVENNISEIFHLLDKFKMKVDLIQNSAISFSVCINDKYNSLDQLISELKPKFKVQLFEEVSLYTIRHFNSDKSGLLSKKNANLLLEQRLENTLQLVIKN